MGATIGEVAEVGVAKVKIVEAKVAVGEEMMMDAPKELVPEEGAMSPIIERATPGGVIGVDDALATQIPSIDTLLSDIYELRY